MVVEYELLLPDPEPMNDAVQVQYLTWDVIVVIEKDIFHAIVQSQCMDINDHHLGM